VETGGPHAMGTRKRLLEEKHAEIFKLAELRLRQLEDVLSAKRIHGIEEVSRIMGDVMMPVQATVSQSEPYIQQIDKIKVFVLERMRPGESLMSIFDALSG
jgi:hypothetical protein